MPCCSLFFGTKSTQADCLLPTAINRNSTAFYYFPLATAPTAGKGRMIYVRLFSNQAITGITLRIYVGSPLVNGQFSTDPTLYCEYTLSGSWTVSGDSMYQNSAFTFTPTQQQVTNNICMVAKVYCPGTSGCVSPTGFTDIGKNPLAAVFDRPWP